MNRAWIPAGALAGVSVAGLIALGPLTDSLSSPVSFPTSVAVKQAASTASAAVPVRLDVPNAGKTKTAALKPRGGAAGTTQTTSDTGFVADRRQVTPTPSSSSTGAPPTIQKPAVKPKKTPKRQESIGTSGEANGDNGLAGGSDGSTELGEQASTPSNDSP